VKARKARGAATDKADKKNKGEAETKRLESQI